jgi:hypothetical protein
MALADGRRDLPSKGPRVPAAAEIVLPSVLYMIAGYTYRLVYADVISGFVSTDVVRTEPLAGSVDHGDRWEYTPSDAGSFDLSVTVSNDSGTVLAAASRPIVVLSPPSGEGRLRHLSIGDSITRAGGYTQLAACILRGRTVGTRTYDGGVVSGEGRGGWTMQAYMTRIGEVAGGDSPFLFPTDIDGGRFRGNTNFWKDVTVGDPDGYDYDGFQQIARGWQDGGPYVFDSNGFPSPPRTGDVVVDPTLAAGAQWREYDGTAWSALKSPPQVDVSFSKYLDRYSSAFEDGKPSSVSIMLGTVDFLSTLTDATWATFKTRLDELIASIRAWSKDVPIILIGSPSGGPDALWADKRVSGSDFNRRIIEHSRRLYAAYDTTLGRSNNVYVISFLGVVSPRNMADYVHPKMPEGHDEMGPWLAGILAHLLSTGKL